MHQFLKEISLIIGALSEASAKIESIDNHDMHLLKTKIAMDLKRHIDALKLQIGIDPGTTAAQVEIAAPLTKMFGKDVTPGAKPTLQDVNKPGKQTVEDVESAELRLKADELYPRFISTPSDHLLDSVSDIEIRAVAKRAGLPVTETSPDRITTTYIEQIKSAIQRQISTATLADENKSPGEPNAPSTFISDEDKELAEIRTLYKEFESIDKSVLLENTKELHIRAVAKIAGLPVTETSPKKIDGKFIEQVKTAIKKKAELEAAGNKV